MVEVVTATLIVAKLGHNYMRKRAARRASGLLLQSDATISDTACAPMSKNHVGSLLTASVIASPFFSLATYAGEKIKEKLGDEVAEKVSEVFEKVCDICTDVTDIDIA